MTFNNLQASVSLMKPIITTDKIQLKILEKADAQNLHALRTNPEVTKYIKRDINKTLLDMEDYIEEKLSDPKKPMFFTIKTLDNNEFAGTICLWKINPAEKYAEVGYELLPSFQRKGIMSHALKTILDFAFNELGFEYIEAYTHHENIPSRKMLGKVGFKHIENKIDEGNLDNVIFGIRRFKFPADNADLR